jgi:hypothetical protein
MQNISCENAYPVGLKFSLFVEPVGGRSCELTKIEMWSM